MGRWRGRRYKKRNHFQNKKDEDDGNSKDVLHGHSTKDGASNMWRAREDLIPYLKEYREGCLRFYNEVRSAELEGVGIALSSPSISETIFKPLSTRSKNSASKTARIIGGVPFPLLTEKVFTEPFLILPPTLSKFQRRVVHECCLEQDLFHDSFAFGEDRVIAVSLYADGLDGLQRTPTVIFDAHKCKPWYCRRVDLDLYDEKESSKHSHSLSVAESPITTPNPSIHAECPETPLVSNKSSIQARAEEEALTAIYKLIDQPGNCLRVEHDLLVYRELSEATLAEIPPPTPNDSEHVWMLVDSAEKMKLCVEELTQAEPTELGFDLEAFNVNKHTQLTCLLQIASNTGKEYVIDTLAPGVWDEVHRLAPLFADPTIVKIGHSTASLDIRSLHRDFGIFVVNLFDTYEAAVKMGMESLGLAAVGAHYGLPKCSDYAELKKSYQSCDWRQRPLTEPMILYARYDVHFLVQLRWLMMRDMIEKDLWGQQQSRLDSEREDRLVAESLLHTLAKIRLSEEDNVSDDDLLELFHTPVIKGLDVLAMMDVNDPGNIPSDDATFKTAAMSKSDDESFHTANALNNSSFFMDDNDVYRKDITAADLRLQPLLMSVISISQERCRTLWKLTPEEHRNHHLFQSIMKRVKKGRLHSWKPSSTELYDELCMWCEQVANELECLPGFVATLDFLIAVAWKRPTTKSGLYRLNTQLPVVLEQYPHCCDQLLDLVLRKSLEDGATSAGNVLFYSSLPKTNRYLSAINRSDESTIASFDTVLKVFVASMICHGLVLAILDARRKMR